ncbi:MAG: hypothetical protein AB1418_06470 [Pseudomonadota bacterium]
MSLKTLRQSWRWMKSNDKQFISCRDLRAYANDYFSTFEPEWSDTRHPFNGFALAGAVPSSPRRERAQGRVWSELSRLPGAVSVCLARPFAYAAWLEWRAEHARILNP